MCCEAPLRLCVMIVPLKPNTLPTKCEIKTDGTIEGFRENDSEVAKERSF